MNHRRIALDCGGRSPSEILNALASESSASPNGHRVILFLEGLTKLKGSPKELITCLVDYFHDRQMPASIIDATGIAVAAYSRLGGSMLVEVCRNESDVMKAREILLVDDAEDSLQFMRSLLTKVGHRVTCVTTGREALAQHERARFDVVLLDLVLPDMDGISIASQLAEDNVPVIAMSAYLDRWDALDLRRGQFKRILPKPCGINDVLGALRSL